MQSPQTQSGVNSFTLSSPLKPHKPTLYSYFRSSCSWRVRIALHLKKIDFEYIPVNLAKGEQTREPYECINPNCSVPSFVLPTGDILTQSVAILEYLEETHPEPRLLPSDPIQRAHVRAIVQLIACDIQPLQNLQVLKYAGEERKLEWATHFITKGLESLERHLISTSVKYSVDSNVTMADVCLVPQVYNAKRFDVDLAQFPNIMRVNDELLKLNEFRMSAPGEQVDVPEELKGKV